MELLRKYKLNEAILRGITKSNFDYFPGFKDELVNLNTENKFEPYIEDIVRVDYNTHPFISLPKEQNDVLDHPYYSRIQGLQVTKEYMQYAVGGEDKFSKPDYQIVWINLEAKLRELSEDIVRTRPPHIFLTYEVNEIRSYRGIICLMLIHYNGQVFVIDTITLRKSMRVLNPVLIDASIVKVLYNRFHFCTSIERDFSLYVVNVYDLKALFYNVKGYDLGLVRIINNETPPVAVSDESMTDYRIRPLWGNQLKASYLKILYLPTVYTRLLRRVDDLRFIRTFNECKDVCNIRYTKPKFVIPMGFELDRRLVNLSIVRDALARIYDVSPQFLCTDNSLKGLLQILTDEFIFYPIPYVHPLMRKYRTAILESLRLGDVCSALKPAFQELGMPFPEYGKYIPRFKRNKSTVKTHGTRRWIRNLR